VCAKALRTLTVLTLGLSDRLRQSLATTNAIESLISRTRHVKRNVKQWRSGQMVLRWTAAAVLEAVKGFRRLRGHKDMPKLVAALRARDRQLGIAVSQWRTLRRMSPEPPLNFNSERGNPSNGSTRWSCKSSRRIGPVDSFIATDRGSTVNSTHASVEAKSTTILHYSLGTT
jgi:hypothetical protein